MYRGFFFRTYVKMTRCPWNKALIKLFVGDEDKVKLLSFLVYTLIIWCIVNRIIVSLVGLQLAASWGIWQDSKRWVIGCDIN